MSDLRYSRSRYLALGVPCLLNASLLGLYAQHIDRFGWHDQAAVPVYWLLAASYGLLGVSAMIKRSRDIGSSAWGILLGFLFAPPLMLLIALVLIGVPSNPAADALAPPPAAANKSDWQKGLLYCLLPWLPVLWARAF